MPSSLLSSLTFNTSPAYRIIENYIYIYQLKKYVILPVYPDNVQDSLGSNFATENILARTAPVYSYSNSGPRTVNITLNLHRDLMTAVNYDNTNFIDDVNRELGDDYVDTLIRYLQAMALPSYNAVDLKTNTSNSMVNAPLVALRLGTAVMIKGIVSSTVTVTYGGPISQDGKYMQVDVSFTITEVEPQDAETLAKNGSFRSLSTVLTRGLYKTNR